MKKYIVEVNGTDYEVIIKNSVENHSMDLSNGQLKDKTSTVGKLVKSEKTTAEENNSEDMISVEAPMSGKILSIKTDVGKIIKQGETIITLEAMKMETEISAPVNGRIQAIKVREGDNCQNGAVLALIEEEL